MEELEPKELQEENQTETSHLPSGGKLIFGAKKPAAYAFAHPWPPTPTNLTKKQVLRSARSEKRDKEGGLCKFRKARSTSAPPKAPKHTSAIELAIYWDRSPFWNFMLPDSLTCPVHGRAERSRDSSAKSRRSCDSGRDSLTSKGSQSLKEVKQGRKSADSASKLIKSVKEDPTNGSLHSRESSCTDRIKNKERVMSSEHFSIKEEDAAPSNLSASRRRSKSAIDLQKTLQESSSRYKANGIGMKPSCRRSSSASSLSSDHQSIKNLHDTDVKKEESVRPDTGKESLRRSMSANSVSQRTLGLPKSDEKVEEGKVEGNRSDEKTEKVKTDSESKHCEWNPSRIVRPISDDSSKATKGVQIVEKELNKRFPVSGYLCPLHGSYSRGVARRNTPKFRTVLMRDTSAQADMEMVAAHYCERAKRLAQQVRKSEGNHYSYRNLKRMCKSAGKARDFSEYEENYKNPSSLANAMKRNRNVSMSEASEPPSMDEEEDETPTAPEPPAPEPQAPETADPPPTAPETDTEEPAPARVASRDETEAPPPPEPEVPETISSPQAASQSGTPTGMSRLGSTEDLPQIASKTDDRPTQGRSVTPDSLTDGEGPTTKQRSVDETSESSRLTEPSYREPRGRYDEEEFRGEYDDFYTDEDNMGRDSQLLNDLKLDEDIDNDLTQLELSSDENEEEGVPSKKKKPVLSSDAESSPASDPEEGGEYDRPFSPDFPPEYWQVQRLIKYIKAGNPTATIISMSSLRDFNLRDKYVQLAIRESGGLEVLLNILETEENRCKIASLLVLREITSNPEISRSIYNMKGLETLIGTLRDPAKELKLLSAEAIANISKIRKARRAMRKGDGISRLVDMLDFESDQAHGVRSMGDFDETELEVPRCGALALWSIAKSTKNKDAIRKAGAIPLIAKLLRVRPVSVVIPVVGILQECASEPSFRLAIRTEGLLQDFVHGLKSFNHQLVQFCASAIHMCAEDPDSRQIVYDLGAIDPLIGIIKDPVLRKNKPLLAATTGAIWKCSAAIAAGGKYLKEGLIELLVSLLDDEPEIILTNVAGAIEQIVKTVPANAALIKRAGAIPPLIGLLTINNPDLLVNATKAVGELARDPDSRKEMDSQDGFRLVWSLLKHPSAKVQSSAAWAICPYVESTTDSGDMVRNFVGGLEALVNLLKSDNMEVQGAVSQAVAVIAKNQENLAIMSDHGVVKHLARLTGTTNDMLRRCVATAIAECCNWKTNSAEFGSRRAVSPICMYLTSEDPLVHTAAARALAALSTDARNCITMHQCGIVPYLINMIGSLDSDLQSAAASTMYNIRKLALATEKIRLR